MTKPKNLILLLLLFIVVGIAAVSTNVIINGSTPIASNPDDFNVYFSNVLVNGVQDLSLVKNSTSLVFTGEFSAVGDKKEITYDVTNASKNYDADIDISCTQSTTYLTISNSFNTSSNLAATRTRTGVLSITLSKSYTGADLTQDISCTITASAVERTSQGSGSVAAPAENPFYVGREISIGEEKFNVISSDATTVTMLAQFNIDSVSYTQSSTQASTSFSNSTGWEYYPGPKEIDIQTWTTNPKTYVNAYVEYLKEGLGDDTVTGDLITLKDLEALGCTVPADYAWVDDSSTRTCVNSPYGWIANGQYWWTRSTDSTNSISVWFVNSSGDLSSDTYYYGNGVRPTITIPKETALALMKYKTYTIGEKISIGDENFNVISQTPATVTMLAQYNIDDSTHKQTETEKLYEFSDSYGWEYTPGPKEIDIQEWNGETKTVLNNYVSYLKTEYDIDSTVNLASLYELKKLGCDIDDSYTSTMSMSCSNSQYKSWLVNDQYWWTRSANAEDSEVIYTINNRGAITVYAYYNSNSVRPTITISKEALE